MSTEKWHVLADEIIQMGQADQAMRQSGTWDASLDAKHTLRLKQIIEEIGGWPTISKVGRQASHIAWLLVQHADHDLVFQRTCLALLKALPEGEVTRQDMAYLEDRVLVSESRPQLYGTQFHRNEAGELEPFPIENEEQIDVRRSEVGLGTFAEYRARLQTHRSPP